jgi:predicted nucleic acid-binding protein
LIRKRNDDSIALFNDVKKGKYDALTSALTLLEIIENEQKHIFDDGKIVSQKQYLDDDKIKMPQIELTLEELDNVDVIIEREIYQPYVEIGRIKIAYLSKNGWNKAVQLQTFLPISPDDAKHLAMALTSGCDVFVTKDSRLRTIASQNFESYLMGFSNPKNIEYYVNIVKKARKVVYE